MDDMPDRFTKARKEAGLSQVLLAERLHVSQQSIEKLENGHVKKPKYLKEAADILGVRYDWLLNGEGPMKNNHDEWVKEQIQKLQELHIDARTTAAMVLDQLPKKGDKL